MKDLSQENLSISLQRCVEHGKAPFGDKRVPPGWRVCHYCPTCQKGKKIKAWILAWKKG